MSTFQWEISEPAKDNAEVGLHGGAVKLDGLKPVGGVSVWQVENHNGSLALVARPGGEVKLADSQASNPIISRAVVNICVILALVVVSFIVIYDVLVGQLTFRDILATVATLFVGIDLGFRKAGKSNTRNNGSAGRNNVDGLTR